MCCLWSAERMCTNWRAWSLYKMSSAFTGLGAPSLRPERFATRIIKCRLLARNVRTLSEARFKRLKLGEVLSARSIEPFEGGRCRHRRTVTGRTPAWQADALLSFESEC